MHSKQKDNAARRSAKRVGLLAMKSRRALSSDNKDGYLLLNPRTNFIVCGERFDLSADDVIAFCATRPTSA